VCIYIATSCDDFLLTLFISSPHTHLPKMSGRTNRQVGRSKARIKPHRRQNSAEIITRIHHGRIALAANCNTKASTLRSSCRGWTILRKLFHQHRLNKRLINRAAFTGKTKLTQDDVTAGNHFLRNCVSSTLKAMDVWSEAKSFMSLKEDFPRPKSRPITDLLCRFEPSLKDLIKDWDGLKKCELNDEEAKVEDAAFDTVADDKEGRRMWRDPDEHVMGQRCPLTICRIGRPLLDIWTIMKPYPCNRGAISKLEASQRRLEARRPGSRPQSVPVGTERPKSSNDPTRPKANVKKLAVDENGWTVFDYSLAHHRSLIKKFGPDVIKPLVVIKK